VRGLSSNHRALTLHRGRVTLLSELFRRSASGGWDFRATISPLTAGILGDCEQRAFILRTWLDQEGIQLFLNL
jgi:hypothetical protein